MRYGLPYRKVLKNAKNKQAASKARRVSCVMCLTDQATSAAVKNV